MGVRKLSLIPLKQQFSRREEIFAMITMINLQKGELREFVKKRLCDPEIQGKGRSFRTGDVSNGRRLMVSEVPNGSRSADIRWIRA
jgi:hypothetical protein